MFEAEEEGAGVFEVLSRIAWIRQSDLEAVNRHTADVFVRSSCECRSRGSASVDRILRFKRARTRSRSIAAMSCGEALMIALRAMAAFTAPHELFGIQKSQEAIVAWLRGAGDVVSKWVFLLPSLVPRSFFKTFIFFFKFRR